MSYVFFPPRVSNFFPGGPPYLSGFHGLGDYATELAAYQADLRKWRLESLNYNRTLKFNAAKVKAIDAAYAAALSSYAADKAKWDNEYAAYLVAFKAWDAGNKDNAARSMKIAQAYGLNLTQGYYLSGACLSQAQHNEYARQCVTVKGIMGLGSSDPDCGMKALPVCVPAPTIRAKPVAPTKGTYPSAPTLRAKPTEPTAPPPTPVTVATPVPVSTPVPTAPGPMTTPESAPEPPAPEQQHAAGMVTNGLIIIAVLGGGYLIYRTLKKPKAA